MGMVALLIQVTLKELINSRLLTTPNRPWLLVKRLKWDTYCKTNVDDCAYARASHLDQLKRTHR